MTTSTWYCADCETTISGNDIDEHEAKGHSVRGHIVPDRLLPGNPWLVGANVDTEEGED